MGLDTNTATQLGLGGLLVWVVLREVFGFLRGRKNGNGNGKPSAGEMSAEYWQGQQRQIMIEVTSQMIIPILANQTQILDKMETAVSDQAKNIAILMDRRNTDR